MNIDIILRTHDLIDIHPAREPRYCGVDKTTLIRKCVTSLVNTADNYEGGNIQFIWLDDHSSQITIDYLHDIFKKSKHPYEFVPLEESGFNYSGYMQFEMGRKSTADLVYFVEDDYLHYPTTIDEMVDSYVTFKKNLGVEVGIHPFDDPDNYKTEYIDECRIVLGKNRKFRTNKYSTFVFLCSPELIRKHWSRFYMLSTEYMTEWGERNMVHEGTTINHIWRWEAKLFTPIPSLALHMGFNEQKDAFLDWKELWNSMEIEL
jgi:Glycosyl transferase family 2